MKKAGKRIHEEESWFAILSNINKTCGSPTTENIDTVMTNFFVITGGPSSGKTTLIQALKKEGYPCIDEAAREILKKEEMSGGDSASYRNTPEFIEIEFQQSLANYMQAKRTYPHAITFFDRGLVDVLVYASFRNIPISNYMKQAALTHRYNSTVFIAPPWHAIYRTDNERIESYEEAVRIFQVNVAVYREYGYSLVELPRTSVQERVVFIVGMLQNMQDPSLQ